MNWSAYTLHSSIFCHAAIKYEMDISYREIECVMQLLSVSFNLPDPMRLMKLIGLDHSSPAMLDLWDVRQL